jgi:sugar O-acyltransferase (sialic acid O-acetyltransferase NeuD family)
MRDKKILIYGASGHGKVIIDIIAKQGNNKIVGLIDDNPQMLRQNFCGYPVLGGFDVLREPGYQNYKLILAIGNNNSRKGLWERIMPLGYELICAVHPSAQIGKDVFMGSGTVVMANVAINPGASIGENVIVNTGATIDHDCLIGDHVHISPGTHLGGNVEIGDLTHIGIGVSIIPNIKIGKGAIVGSGAVVVGDIPDNVTAVGIPAKVIKKNRKENF